MNESADKLNFFHSHSRYRNRLTPDNSLYNANLQELAQKVSYIYGLQTGGKISPAQADEQIESLWKQFKHAKKQLGIGQKN